MNMKIIVVLCIVLPLLLYLTNTFTILITPLLAAPRWAWMYLRIHNLDTTGHPPAFTSQRQRPVRIAIIGGGIGGLSTAYTLAASNVHREERIAQKQDGSIRPESASLQPCSRWKKGEGDNGVPLETCLPPSFEITLFEKSSRLGGHSYTVHFPLANGSTYPVDLAYAYNPTRMSAYEDIRKLERRHNIQMKGPLQQKLAVYRKGFQVLSEQEELAMDEQCERFMKIVAQLNSEDKVMHMVEYQELMKIKYGLMSMRAFLRINQFSDAFFMYRLYPPIRFVIVSGSKAKILDSFAMTSLSLFRRGWATCHRKALHGHMDWYTVAGGSEQHVLAMQRALQQSRAQTSIRLGTSIERVSLDKREKGIELTYLPDAQGAAHSEQSSELFDAVVMATPVDDAARILGSNAPRWATKLTMESIEVSLHSDERLIGPRRAKSRWRAAVVSNASAEQTSAAAARRLRPTEGGRTEEADQKTQANMVYVAGNVGDDAANATLSVYWDSIHGELVHPRPIVTYNPDFVLNGRKALKGEVTRVKFKHLQFPDLTTYLELMLDMARARSEATNRIFWSGSFVDFSLSHPGALISGVRTALALGARYNSEKFFLSGASFFDPPDYISTLRASGGRDLGAKRANCDGATLSCP